MLADDFQNIIRDYADDGKLGGIYMAVPTGEVLEEDPTLIEIVLYGMSMYAKPCMSFGSFNVPDKDWLLKYKDEVNIWVAFENGNPAHPVYMGVVPRDGKYPKEDYPKIKLFKTLEFAESYNDAKKLYSLLNKRDLGVRLDESIIFLGSGGKTESSVLGNTLKVELVKALGSIATSLTVMTSSPMIVNPTTGTAVLPPPIIARVKSDMAKVQTVIAGLDKILSKNVKLD